MNEILSSFDKLLRWLIKSFRDLNSFDSVLAISVLEHVGMGHYGDEFVENADKISMKKIYDILKPNGIVFISVPGGRKKIYEKNGIKYIRIFDPETIEKLCENFVIEKEYFYKI